MTHYEINSVSTLLCLLMPVLLHSQNNPQYREYKSEYVTYPYSDPNPIPTLGRIILTLNTTVLLQNQKRKNGRLLNLKMIFKN